MMKKATIVLSFLFISLFLYSEGKDPIEMKIDSLIKVNRNKYVPDAREAVYDITYTLVNNEISLIGATSNQKAYAEIIKEVSKLGNKNIKDNVKLLPDKQLGDTLYGVINVSVADVRTQNRFTSGMATQALLGTPVKLLEKNGWYRIQTPDTYIGWAHERQIVPMNKKEYNKWLIAPKVIYTNHYGLAYARADKEGAIVSDLVAGDILQFVAIEGDFFKVSYPDNREAFILRKESQEYAIWLQSRKPTAESFVEMAKSMTGIPYVWGGTSTKGMDCSGLVSTVMKLHGLTILRDASQQATVGTPIDISEGYNNLEVGDLIFFGNEESIRHVGFYLGNMQFIHASGWTRISSLNPNDDIYDELNTKEFIKATRIIDGKQLKGLQRMKDNPFYFIQK